MKLRTSAKILPCADDDGNYCSFNEMPCFAMTPITSSKTLTCVDDEKLGCCWKVLDLKDTTPKMEA